MREAAVFIVALEFVHHGRHGDTGEEFRFLNFEISVSGGSARLIEVAVKNPF
jgi:hypothetical protein